MGSAKDKYLGTIQWIKALCVQIVLEYHLLLFCDLITASIGTGSGTSGEKTGHSSGYVHFDYSLALKLNSLLSMKCILRINVKMLTFKHLYAG